MSSILTVTRVPEEHFRRFSRFPYVAATKLDDRYNNVNLKPSINLKPSTKSAIRVFDNPVPINTSREVTFDFANETKVSNTVLVSPSPLGVVHKQGMKDRSKQVTKTEIEENRGKSFIEVRKNSLVVGKESDIKVRRAKGEVLDMLAKEQSDKCLTSYDLTKATDSPYVTRNQSANQNDFVGKSLTKGVTDDLDEKKTNIGNNVDALIVNAKGDMYADEASRKLTSFPHDVPKTKSPSEKERPLFLRNTRYGGNTKITAYRPCTSIDRFRTQKLEAVREISVDGSKHEKDEQLWTQVDNIIENSANRKKRMRQQLDQQRSMVNPSVAMETSQKLDRTIDLKYAIELRPLVGCQSTRQNNIKRLCSNESSLVNDEHIIGQEDDTCVKSFSGSEVIDGLTSHGLIEYGLQGGFSHSEKSVNYYQIYPGPLVYLAKKGTCNGKKIAMTTTTLPRIASSRTPLPTGITQPPPRSHSSASMYTAYPPKDLSSSLDYLRIPGRINPLAPPPPRRRINWSWETTDQHYENEKRSLLMQKREHTRYHSAWSKAFYGAPAEKEAYRRHFREVLKQQMSDKNKMEKIEFQEKIKETEQAINYDRDCRMNDAQEYHRKHSYLMQYRDTNKQQMEDRWANTKYSRELENRIDRERLRYNPINWSCSLK